MLAQVKSRRRAELSAFRISAERSAIAWYLGKGDVSKLIDRSDGAERGLAAPVGLEGAAFAAAFAVNRAHRALSSGEYEQARRLLDRAQSLTSTLLEAPPLLTVDLLLHYAALNTLMRGPREATRRDLSKAHAVALQHGFMERGALVVWAASADAQFHGECGRETEHLKAVYAKARGSMSALNYGLVGLRTAELLVELGDPAQALAYLDLSRPLIKCSPLAAMIADMLAAKAHYASKRYEAAIGSAIAAHKEAQMAANGRATGAILHVLSLAQWNAGKTREAVNSIEASLELLEHHGHPQALQRAYADSALITGNRAHFRAAREIGASASAR